MIERYRSGVKGWDGYWQYMAKVAGTLELLSKDSKNANKIGVLLVQVGHDNGELSNVVGEDNGTR